MKELSVFGSTVKKDGDMVCLNDLHAIAGRHVDIDGKMAPRDWARKAGRGFVEHIQNRTEGPVIRSKPGKGGGTFGHWQIALAYAEYLSPELHQHVNEVYARYSGADASLAADIADRQTDPEQAKWIAARANAKRSRLELTDTLKEHGVNKPYQYGVCTNEIYRPILGGTAKEVKQTRNVPAKQSLRDSMSLMEVMATGLAEELAKKGIRSKNAHGFGQCRSECRDAGGRVASIL